ncbi:mandelate racemase/muconate lactonizing enzyme family protein [Alcaligenes ammonioxydans]|uniref:mandelate racemase/muconate lactonizing enzyme family protein n=1 Tax=Alcaligenes ammonioxydans TaxID=2582914 RepID=UPI000269EACF|nr:mandelate racemase/muconate lactonizing enzyme family protein [Alcaligenes ammonioxydans]EJC61917.1 mandelate racemase/muconate lactonizing protein [Alcaligenes faecalis subsp. faecalis NCIB 8687]MCH1879122.1 mandelate racemase/muconate lactonizing enzyme family protein [Alcaligenes ammonioxydans]WGQ36012.1 mandelate racemase/muconate lactonizing enzyme family protein [Alcaligenes faecalis]
MRITAVRAIPLNVPFQFHSAGIKKPSNLAICHVEIETDEGITGYGLSAITEEHPVASTINDILASDLVGQDPLNTERLWDRMYWNVCPRGQTGYAMHAISALDIALWDIKGKALGLPVWKLLGGAREKVPAYATFGFAFLNEEELVKVAQNCVDQGFKGLKMVVGHHGLQRRDEPRPLAELIRQDMRRMSLVRESIPAEMPLYIDGNCSLDYVHAKTIARHARELDVGFFEEPITQNDTGRMRELRQSTGITVAAGQNEGQAYRFRDLLMQQAVDIVQPNVLISGGFTQSRKIFALAESFNASVANGGAFPSHNGHLHCGLLNGGDVEWHLAASAMMAEIYTGLPQPEQGWLHMPDAPGLGLSPRQDQIDKLRSNPGSLGSGKG